MRNLSTLKEKITELRKQLERLTEKVARIENQKNGNDGQKGV